MSRTTIILLTTLLVLSYRVIAYSNIVHVGYLYINASFQTKGLRIRNQGC